MNQEVTNPDNWENHWNQFADSASINPAQRMRHRIIVKHLKNSLKGPHSRILEIGSGQGDLLKHLRSEMTSSEFLGVELSQSGVEISQKKVPDATFISGDFFDEPKALEQYKEWATQMICAEVLEHLDDPATFLRTSEKYLQENASVIVTVPGGKMSAFDRLIGHRCHYTKKSLRQLLESSGFEVKQIYLAGFPFFNIYRWVVMARGEKLVADAALSSRGFVKMLGYIAMRVFDWLFRLNLPDSRYGWQLVAIAKKTEGKPHDNYS